jgi:16S rRNA (uracil1498-N3)-methyltransferase
MASKRAPPRLFVAAPLALGATVELAPAQAHYVVNVMRRAEGDSLLLFNGSDGEWRAEISAARRGRGVAAAVVEQTRPQAPEPDVWLMFAAVKRTPTDLIARGATELGASALWPVLTRRTATGRVNLDRLRANAVEAAEQCRRLTVPECFALAPLETALAECRRSRRLMVCDGSGDGAPIVRALKAGSVERGVPWAVLVGPEGGFDAADVAAFAALPGVVRVSLGPRTLRAETAALAGLVCWQSLVGDWR